MNKANNVTPFISHPEGCDLFGGLCKEMLPEVDKYLWVKIEDLKKYLNLKQFNIIDSIKNLIS